MVGLYDSGRVDSPIIIHSLGAEVVSGWVGLRCDLGRREEVQVHVFGKTWWISLFTLVLQAVLAGLQCVTAGGTAVTATALGAMAVVAASHNIGLAMTESASAKATATVDVADRKNGVS